MLQKCLKGLAFIRITPMAKNIKISTYKRDFVVIFYISQSTGEQFVSSYFIYNENNALVHSIDFERSIQNEKEEMYIYRSVLQEIMENVHDLLRLHVYKRLQCN